MCGGCKAVAAVAAAAVAVADDELVLLPDPPLGEAEVAAAAAADEEGRGRFGGRGGSAGGDGQDCLDWRPAAAALFAALSGDVELDADADEQFDWKTSLIGVPSSSPAAGDRRGGGGLDVGVVLGVAVDGVVFPSVKGILHCVQLFRTTWKELW